jgi:hypothetical protein
LPDPLNRSFSNAHDLSRRVPTSRHRYGERSAQNVQDSRRRFTIFAYFHDDCSLHMKKRLIALLGLIIIAIVAVYIIIPQQINATQTVRIKCTAGAANRYLANDTKWLQWWPAKASVPTGTSQNQSNAFIFKDHIYQPEQKMFDAVGVQIKSNKLTINSTMILVPLNKDSVLIQWEGHIKNSNNPFTRIQRYRQVAVIKKDMKHILGQLKYYLEKEEKVYGITIQKTIVKDTLLLVTQQVFDTSPSTLHVYSLINKLKDHIRQQGADETGYPMLNIRKKDSTHFETMVAIPVSKEVKEHNGIVMKYMVPGNILKAEVHGGMQTANNAFAQMENYVLDHHFESPAIPFYSLITNRLTETDTSKWLTAIYYPIY